MIDKRRQAAVLTACGATIMAGLSSLARHFAGVAGLSADAWQWVPLGLSFALIAAALVMVVRIKQGDRQAR